MRLSRRLPLRHHRSDAPHLEPEPCKIAGPLRQSWRVYMPYTADAVKRSADGRCAGTVAVHTLHTRLG